MLRSICIIVLALSLCVVFSQEVVENDSLLLWQSDRPLTWEDFKGEQLNYHGNVLAEAHGNIKTINSYWLGDIPMFDVRCYFIKYSSWTITNDSISLEHEQIHFNIYELFARKIRKNFEEFNKNKIKDFKEYDSVFHYYLEENKKYNNMYDIDVITNQEKQQEWQSRIAKELEDLKAYEYVPEE